MKYFCLLSILFFSLFFYSEGYPADFLGLSEAKPKIKYVKYNQNHLMVVDRKCASETTKNQNYHKETYSENEYTEELSEGIETIADPLEPYNRAIFKFNDKFYYWFLKPAARGYGAVLPEKARISVRKLFSNADMPFRLVNCVLQGRMKGAAIESTRFIVNTTLGVAGLFNPAESLFHLKEQEADFDQTLGRYGMEPVFFINWPLLGPSSLRGTLGLIAYTACSPETYLASIPIKVGIRSYEKVNITSLTIGDYEALTEPALDPYIAVRNAYYQNRKSKLQVE